jgi:vacuolar-type H+-ATPase subunit H
MNEATQALEEIRHTELAAARHVEEARDRAVGIGAEARAQSRQIVEEGREQGRAAARRRLEMTLEASEAEAASVRTRSESEAQALGDTAAGSLEPLIEEMMRVVLAPPHERGK